MNMLSKAKEKASGTLSNLSSNLGVSSLGQVASSAASWSSSSASSLGDAIGQLHVGSRAANAAARGLSSFKDLVSAKSRLVVGSLPTALVPDQRVEYAVILPPKHRGSDDEDESLPLLLTLHGLKGSRDGLIKQHEHGDWDTRFASGVCPELVVATISGGDNYYMDFFDRSAMWETFLVEEFIPFLIRTFNCGATRQQRYLMGGSMGGHGALKLAFRHPDKFAAVAVFEPAIDAALENADLCRRNHQWAQAASNQQSREIIIQMWGGAPPHYDSLHYRLHNPVSIANDNAAAIRESSLKIYLDVGDKDCLNLHDGVEFLHRVLWDHGIEHEYHLVHGADHVGASLPARMTAVFRWLGATIQHTLTPEPEDRFKLDEEELKFLKGVSRGDAGDDWRRQGRPVSLESDKMIPLFRATFGAAMQEMLGVSNEGPPFIGGFRWRSGGAQERGSSRPVPRTAGVGHGDMPVESGGPGEVAGADKDGLGDSQESRDSQGICAVAPFDAAPRVPIGDVT